MVLTLRSHDEKREILLLCVQARCSVDFLLALQEKKNIVRLFVVTLKQRYLANFVKFEYGDACVNAQRMGASSIGKELK